MPRNRTGPEPEGKIGDDNGKIPVPLEQLAPGSVDQLGRQGRRSGEPVDDELVYQPSDR
jgi:hypothetical protein